MTKLPNAGLNDGPEKRTSISRQASIARYCASNKLPAESAATFIAREGGIVACEKKDRQAQSASRNSKSAAGGKGRLTALEATAVELTESELRKHVPQGYYTIFGWRGADGKMRMLSAK
jgi:hypothetical protein